jgi:hypothetical protein
MGRFDDVLLVNGDPNLKLTVRAREVVQPVNTANTGFSTSRSPVPGWKLVGGDSGRHEHEQFAQS